MTKSELQLAIEAIEDQLHPDLCSEMEWKLCQGGEFTHRDSVNMAEMLGNIYRIAHSANEKHECFRVHADWRKLFLKPKVT